MAVSIPIAVPVVLGSIGRYSGALARCRWVGVQRRDVVVRLRRAMVGLTRTALSPEQQRDQYDEARRNHDGQGDLR
jgi:hypothetical protein